jgi:hypothetical protein
MRKQMLKGITMFMLVMGLSLATAAISANAQSLKARANVPFDFVVGDKTLTSGDYTIATVTMAGDALRISSTDMSQTAARLTITADGRSANAKLVFHRYGNRYFLAEIWTGAGAQGRVFMKSRQEKAIEKESNRVAQLSHRAPESYETVAVALN